ncbi:hypothetical protein HGP16_32915 [Rhizobium sp. P40RR-XXII]|uniref:hypothetical protein n=1 Tax=Rhizobium sp. P40RR-XXII TaxID=2726739 RepID=UPI0014567EB8|nr:hypothetical protein [Rhizobium sp. P40RR-XXII]NLS21302.1 hypothetical protein [Rhizobium sp. P40RR-XXII]
MKAIQAYPYRGLDGLMLVDLREPGAPEPAAIPVLRSTPRCRRIEAGRASNPSLALGAVGPTATGGHFGKIVVEY